MTMFAKIQAKRRGFTLIELLVVIVVIAVLAMIVIPKFTDSGKRSKEASLRSDLSQLRSAVATFQTDTGAFPATLNDLTVSAAPATGLSSSGGSAPITASDWHGPYLTNGLPKDPISNADFTYVVTGATTGKVTSSATGNGLDNTAYSTY